MELIIRATAIFWFLWLVVRGTGKRSLAELTPLDLILVVVIGDIVQQGVTQEDMSVTGAMAAVSVFVIWTLAADSLGRRFPRVARAIAGEPIIVVKDGSPLRDRMRKERVTMEDLREAARIEGIGDLEEIEFAVLETDGKFSFITKPGRP
ncbi:MAG TPA: YetF domain-containing protein [Acidimicrobiia bacterium]|nr:YetF domain-containing protein [Acidimicrobiia bacterium]